MTEETQNPSSYTYVSAWEGNARYMLIRKMTELGYNISTQRTENSDEHGNPRIHVIFEDSQASDSYHQFNNGYAMRELRKVLKSNPYSPKRLSWIQDGIPAEPASGSHRELPYVRGVADIVKPPDH